MKHRKGWFLSALLALIIAAALLPAAASAADTDIYIGSVAVTIDAPFVWAYPDYTAEFPDGAHCYTADYSMGELRNDVKWKDVTSDKWMIPDRDTFELGHQYMVEVYLTAEEGYIILTNATGTINGKAAQHRVDSYSGQHVLSYTFPEVTKSLSSVSVYLDRPVVGEKPDYTAQFPGGAFYYTTVKTDTYSRNEITWGDETTGTFMKPDSSVYQSGHAYKVVIYLTATDTFWFTSSTTATLNGQPAQAQVLNGQLLVEYTFPAAAEPITSVSVTLDAPLAGAHPDCNAELPAGAQYCCEPSPDSSLRDYIDWYDPETSQFTPMDPDSSVFRTGRSYEVVIYLTPRDGYAFTSSTTAVLNDRITAKADMAGDRLYVTYTFSETPTPIASASVTLDAPEAGAKPDYTAELPLNAKYYSEQWNSTHAQNDITWGNATLGTFVRADTGVFEAGYAYEVVVNLTPRDGYVFTSGTTATLNGQSAQAEVLAGQLMIKYTFPALPEPITSASVTLEAPKAGNRPSYDAAVPDGAPYYTDENSDGDTFRNDVYWHSVTSNAYVSPDNDWFGINKQYSVSVCLTPREGYSFVSGCTAALNGNAAETEITADGKLKVSYTFPTLVIIRISSLELTVDRPKAGARPDYTPVLPDGAPYYYDQYTGGSDSGGVQWLDLNDYVTLSPAADGVFQPGHTYQLIVYPNPEYGYEFAEDFTATVNGESAETYVFSGSSVLVRYDFPTLPNQISSVSVTLDAPEIGAKPDYTAVLPSGANYYSAQSNGTHAQNDITWGNADEGTFVRADTGVFEAGYAYEVVICLTPRDGYEFTSGTTAKVNGKNASAQVLNGQLMVKYTFPALPAPTYTVTWKNADGTVLETDAGVPKGTVPTYDGPKPQKAATDQYSYSFRGWTPAVQPASKDVTYTATFTQKPVVSVSGAVNGNSLTYTVKNAPSGAMLIAARYDGGRMTWVRTVSAPKATGTLKMEGSGSACRLFLVDADFRPLCGVWTR